MIDDRRQEKRYDIPLNVAYFDTALGRRIDTLAKNISRSGIRFPVNTDILKGAALDLLIEDPNSSGTIASKAEVMWVRNREAGVKLIKKRLY